MGKVSGKKPLSLRISDELKRKFRRKIAEENLKQDGDKSMNMSKKAEELIEKYISK